MSSRGSSTCIGPAAAHNGGMTDPALGDLEARLEDFQRVIDTRDVVAASSVLDDDYALVLVAPEPRVVPRDQWLATLPDYVVHEWTVQERVVDLDGDCAVVLQRGFQRAVVGGAPRDGLFVVSDTWRRRSGVWRVWRRHSTPLEAGPLPGTPAARPRGAPGERFARAVAEKDAQGLVEVLADPLDFRAMTPGRFWEAGSAHDVVEDVVLGHWFEPDDRVTAVEAVETGSVGERQRVRYRFRVTNPDGDFTVEQQAYYDTVDDRITWLRVICSGYQPVAPTATS